MKWILIFAIFTSHGISTTHIDNFASEKACQSAGIIVQKEISGTGSVFALDSGVLKFSCVPSTIYE